MPQVKKTAEYYANNPEAKAKKAKYDKAFNATPEQKKRRGVWPGRHRV